MRPPRRRAAAVLTLLAAAEVCVAQMIPVREKAYWDVVKQYAGAERRPAVTAIGEWTSRDLETVDKAIEGRAKEARKCAACEARQTFDALPLRTALLLHAEQDRITRMAGFLDTGRAVECSPTLQSAQIERLLASVALQPGGVPFATRFVTAYSLSLRSLLCYPSALEWADLGLKVGPGDAALHLTRGLAAESVASSVVAQSVWRTSFDARGRPISGYEPVDRKGALNAALEAFSRTLSLDPQLPGARLHLGRVQWRAGRGAEAKETLRQAVGEAKGPLLYLAHLFYGQCLEDEGDIDGAAAEYHSALSIRRDSQVAAVALAHAHTLKGESDLAREVLDRVLSFAGNRLSLDPFWSYLTGTEETADALLEQLRAEAIP
ncbi:MAG: tetratricopeptide repeat protein [Vicinamibacteria bacterium]